MDSSLQQLPLISSHKDASSYLTLLTIPCRAVVLLQNRQSRQSCGKAQPSSNPTTPHICHTYAFMYVYVYMYMYVYVHTIGRGSRGQGSSLCLTGLSPQRDYELQGSSLQDRMHNGCRGNKLKLLSGLSGSHRTGCKPSMHVCKSS